MYTGLLHLHDLVRWVVLAIAIVVLVKYTAGWLKRTSWTGTDHRLGIILTALIDLQVLIGLILYFFLSPVTRMIFQDFGAVMKNDTLRFYALEHPVMMLIAVALIHIGWARAKKVTPDHRKFGNALLFFVIAFVIMAVAIPWSGVPG